MKYLSTRSTETYSFEDVVMRGLAPDGGLFVPENIPNLPVQTGSFVEMAHSVFTLFTDLSFNDLTSLIDKSYSTFSHPLVTPLVKLPKLDSSDSPLWLLELFHGPTFAFKDVALQFLGNLFEYFLTRRNAGKSPLDPSFTRLNVLGATSGDTGGAAIYGLRGKANIQVFILHPKGRISPMQELQMTSVLDPNVHNIAVEGTFDDCQDIVKALFSDETLRQKFQLAAINSINWGRILAQITYYYYSYSLIVKELGVVRVQYSVPTGNFGDILAGYYAKRLGLPIEKLIIATNENDILHRFLETGRYEKSVDSDVKQTHSPAMDILISSNFERLLFHLVVDSGKSSSEATSQVNGWMTSLKTKGGFTVTPEVLSLARETFGSCRIDNAKTLDTISRYYQLPNDPIVLDPHTAVGVAAAELFSTPGIQTVCLATASPGKFPESVLEACAGGPRLLDVSSFTPGPLAALHGQPRRVTTVTTNGIKEVGRLGVVRVLESTLFS